MKTILLTAALAWSSQGLLFGQSKAVFDRLYDHYQKQEQVIAWDLSLGLEKVLDMDVDYHHFIRHLEGDVDRTRLLILRDGAMARHAANKISTQLKEAHFISIGLPENADREDWQVWGDGRAQNGEHRNLLILIEPQGSDPAVALMLSGKITINDHL